MERISMSGPLTMRFVALFPLCCFCAYYLTRITNISPVYLIFLFSAVMIWFSNPAFAIPRVGVPAVTFFFYCLITQPFLNPDPSSLVGVLFSMVILIFMMATLGRADRTELIRYATGFIQFTTILLVVECIWRITHPLSIVNSSGIDITGEVLWIYPYKINSIMYQDSNFVALVILVVLFFCSYLQTITGKKYWFVKLILLVLLVLTFSRSAWVSAIFTFLILRYFNTFTLKTFLGTLLLATGSVVFLIFFAKDESYLSKFRIVEAAINSFVNFPFYTILVGIGFGNTVDILFVGAHNIALTFLLESGVIGLLLYSTLLYGFLKATKGKAKYIMIPYLLAAFSAFSHANPFFVVPLSLIYFLEKDENRI